VSSQQSKQRKIISVDSRPLRDLGNGTVGVSFDKEAARELGLINDDDEIVTESNCREIVYSDGSISIETPGSSD